MMNLFKRLLLVVAVVSMSAVLVFGGTGHAQSQGMYDVVILVVDDFTGDELDVSELDPEENCVISFEEQAFAVRGATADPAALEAMAHGDWVLAQVEEELEAVGAETDVTVVQVEMHGLVADDLVLAIEEAVDDNPADVYVVNMSFALIPCDYVEAFSDLQDELYVARQAQDLQGYNSLLRRAVIFYDDTVFPVMSQRAQNMTGLSPLQDLFVAQGSAMIPVAAAGNYGLDFPFWPGAWAQVVSVSASVGDGFYPDSAWVKQDDTPLLGSVEGQRGRNTRVSNYGEVMLPGEYSHELGDVSGTSFAAPRMSVAMALYAMQAGPNICRDDDGNPELAYGDWDNLMLDEVAQEYCASLTTALP